MKKNFPTISDTPMSEKFPYQLYLVVGESDCIHHSIEKTVELAIKGGVDIVQLREKDKNYKDFLKTALRLKEITERYKVPLIINDHVKVAIDTPANGIHVGQNDIAPTVLKSILKKNQLIGYSVEDISQVSTADAKAADYLAASPIFSTPTKSDTNTPWQPEGLKILRSKTSQPIVAIGGIHHKNIKIILEAGADCIAVVSAISKAENPQKAAEILKEQIIQHAGSKI